MVDRSTVVQSGKPQSERRKKAAPPKRGKLRVVEEPNPVHVLSLRLPRNLFERLEAVAKKERRSFNNQVAVVVEDWLSGEEEEVEARRPHGAIAFQQARATEEDGEP